MSDSIFEKFSEKKMSRGEFIKWCGVGLGGMIIGGSFLKLASAEEGISGGRPGNKMKGLHDLVVAKGDDPYAITTKAIEGMGGMGRFVKKGGVVLIKPNIGWDRAPEQAANTNPFVVGALVDMCFRSGARRVNVFDITCNDAKRCYEASGIARVAKEKGASVYFADNWNFVKANFNYESPMQGWLIYRDAIECDTFINVPVLKTHGLTGLTLSMKNLMGVCGGMRGIMHSNIGEKLAHLTDFIKPDLTVIDAYRYLKANGPSGGDLKDVVDMKTLVVGTDPVLADAYACKLVDRDPLTVSYIKEAVRQGIGSADFSAADILNA
ncbi:MAG: DUF362 domain-containing protein [Candidatus Omnitrophota bacterium]